MGPSMLEWSRTYLSICRFDRRRCARQLQQPLDPGTKIGPIHGVNPIGFTSIQGRPSLNDSSLMASRPGCR